jgi:hypothetical protein
MINPSLMTLLEVKTLLIEHKIFHGEFVQETDEHLGVEDSADSLNAQVKAVNPFPKPIVYIDATAFHYLIEHKMKEKGKLTLDT